MSGLSVEKRLTLLGGPSSGKSTYLGALIDALEDDALSNLALSIDVPVDSRAWEHLTEPILEGQYPQRTQAGRRLDIDVPLQLSPRRPVDAPPVAFSLRVSDYDGEDVERLFRDRTRGWTDEWRARAHADGVLLFLRPPAIRQLPRPLASDIEMTEAERWRHLAGLSSSSSLPSSPPSGHNTRTGPETFFKPGLVADEIPAPPPARPDDPVRIPTVLALIELLQFIRHVRELAPGERSPRGRLRIAILLAAWDAADAGWQQRGAAAYIGESLPLLADFLWSNFHDADVYCFGVSATGGDLHDEHYRARFQERAEGATGYVTWTDSVGAIHTQRDLSIPLRWALFGDTALAAAIDTDE